MSIKDEQIRNASRAFTSGYGNVNKMTTAAYSALDEYNSYAEKARAAAYAQIDEAAQAQLKNSLEQTDYSKGMAQRDFRDTAGQLNTNYEKVNNRSGTFNSQIQGAGLAGSGYEDTVKGLRFRQYQSDLSGAETALANKIHELDMQYQTAVYQADTEAAARALERKNQAIALRQEITQELISIGQSAYNMDFSERQQTETVKQNQVQNDFSKQNLELSKKSADLSERQFAYSKEQDALQNDLAKKNYELSKLKSEYSY